MGICHQKGNRDGRVMEDFSIGRLSSLSLHLIIAKILQTKHKPSYFPIALKSFLIELVPPEIGILYLNFSVPTSP